MPLSLRSLRELLARDARQMTPLSLQAVRLLPPQAEAEAELAVAILVDERIPKWVVGVPQIRQEREVDATGGVRDDERRGH